MVVPGAVGCGRVGWTRWGVMGVGVGSAGMLGYALGYAVPGMGCVCPSRLVVIPTESALRRLLPLRRALVSSD